LHNKPEERQERTVRARDSRRDGREREGRRKLGREILGAPEASLLGSWLHSFLPPSLVCHCGRGELGEEHCESSMLLRLMMTPLLPRTANMCTRLAIHVHLRCFERARRRVRVRDGLGLCACSAAYWERTHAPSLRGQQDKAAHILLLYPHILPASLTIGHKRQPGISW